MIKRKNKFISVVICSFNGGNYIKECLKSLLDQSYPKNSYEVIVVDDGSTDNTGQLAQDHGVTVIRHETNRGIPSSRNTGLAVARGEIIAYIDGDCVADPRWLENLVDPFADEQVVACGGRIIAYKTKYFAERYLDTIGYGNPASLAFGKSKNPLRRFWVYLKTMFRPVVEAKGPMAVQAVFTANVAYRILTLRTIGGFDETLFSDEDIDVSSRLRKNGGDIIFSPAAIVRHRHHESIDKFIKQTYFRAENTLHYYAKEKKIPPIFPLPFLYFALVVALFMFRPIAAGAFIFLGPFVLYSWWIVRAIRANNFEYLTYGYIQMSIEISTILGLVRGFVGKESVISSSGENFIQKKPLTFTIRHILISVFWGMTALDIAIFYRYVAPILTTPFILLGIFVIPGFLLALLLNIKPQSRSDFVIYAFGLGLSFWIFGGLIINWVLPFMGISAPLRLAPLFLFFNDSVALMALLAWFRNREATWTISRSSFNTPERWLVFVAPILLIMSLLGSLVLNNFGAGYITFAMIAGIGIYMFVLSLIKKPVRDGVYSWSIWCFGAALLLMYSMRSWHLLGWDIHEEYLVFQLTLQRGVWGVITSSAAAYNACLSITIFPTILANFLPISSEYIFKLIIQLLFGMMPVMVFLISRRFVSRFGGVLAGFIFMSQIWFYEQMTALIRQEVAFLFLGMALLTLFDESLSRRKQIILFLIASCALILSHYSTAYVWLAMFFLTLVFSALGRFLIPSLKVSSRKFTWTLFLISVLCIFCWEAVVTQSGNNFTKFAQSSISDFEQAFSPNVIEDGISQIFFSAANPNTQENLQQEIATASALRQDQGGDFYPSSTYADYNPQVINNSLVWPSLVPIPIANFVLLISKISKFLIIDLFALVGTALVIWRLWKKQKTVSHEYLAFCMASFPLILLMLFLPIFSVDYNLTRLFMQIFVVLSVMAVVGGLAFLNFLPRWRMIILTSLIVIIFFYSIGFTARFFGGLAHVTLNEPNGTFDNYYVYTGEVYSAQWFKVNYDGLSPIYADTLAVLRLRSSALINADLNGLFPSTITRDGYVYMTYDNIVRGAAYASFNNDVITYTYPTQFLDKNKNLIYNNGYSRIYK